MAMKYTINWTAVADNSYDHTASTKYVADNFVIWKGRRCYYGALYTADEWHLDRKSDGKELHVGKTAKECKGILEYALKHGHDINKEDYFSGYFGMKFDDDFNVVY